MRITAEYAAKLKLESFVNAFNYGEMHLTKDNKVPYSVVQESDESQVSKSQNDPYKK